METNAEHFSSAATTVRILETLRQARWWVLSLALLGLLIGLSIVIWSKRTYRAEAVLVPVSATQSESLDALSGSFGELAAFAGISGHANERSRLALATLKGKTFIAAFIRREDLMPVLFPHKWDIRRARWNSSPPTELEAVNRFDRRGILKVINNTNTGLVTIQVDWTNRLQVVEWLVSMVAQLNAELRDRAIQESERNIQFLSTQTQQTRVVDVKVAIDELIENQMKRLMLAEAQKEYALTFVDRPITPGPKDYIWPRPLIVLSLGTFMGALLGILVQLGVEHSKKVRKYRDSRR